MRRLQTVPLWLDEGLAEYFEVPGAEPGTVNNEYAVRLARAVQSGWRPDIHRLERLEKVEQMHRADYRESWAWVHFMLHSTPDGKQVLLDYLQSLQRTDHPGFLKHVADCRVARSRCPVSQLRRHAEYVSPMAVDAVDTGAIHRRKTPRNDLPRQRAVVSVIFQLQRCSHWLCQCKSKYGLDLPITGRASRTPI